MNVNELRELLAQRSDGPWELLATAVGVSESVQRTLHGLSASEIEQTIAGDAISPRIVDCRVQALAAWDATLLEEVMTTWLPPDELRNLNVLDSEFDFWLGAWCSAVRFAPPRLQHQLSRTAGLPKPLEDECHVLVSSGASLGVSQSIAEAATSGKAYDELRRLSRLLVADEEVMLSHIDRLIEDRLEPRHLERLLLLLKDDIVFSPAATRRIAELFGSMWILERPYGESGFGWIGMLVLTELACRTSMNHPVLVRARDELIARLSSDGPRAWHCTAYLLAGTNWTCR